MRKSVKIAIATAFAGLVAAGGAAFTATGITNTVEPNQFVGGTVTQTVEGATLATVTYGYEDAAQTKVNSVDIKFTDDNATGQTVTLTANGTDSPFPAGVVLGDEVIIHTALYPLGGYADLSTLNISVSSAIQPPAGG